MRLVLVEDDPGDVRDVRRRLDGSIAHELIHADRLSAALEVVGPDTDCVLLDLGLPDVVGLEGLAQLLEAAPDVPVVVLTKLDNDKLALEAVRCGADDYLVKGRLSDDTLTRCVRYAVERGRLRRELRARERFAQTVLESLPTPTGVLDTSGVIVAVNRAWRDVVSCGCRPPCGPGRPYDGRCIRLAGVEDVVSGLAGVLRGALSMLRVGYVVDAPSGRRWFTMRASPLPGGGAVVVHVDNTDERRTDSALRESLGLLEAVTEGTTDSVVAKDLDGRYLLINSSGAAAMGGTVAEMLGRTDTELFGPDEAAAIAASDSHIMSSGASEIVEETSTATGVSRTFLRTKGPLRNPAGAVIGLVVISRDITDRKAAEESVRRSEEHLREAQAVARVGSWHWSLDSDTIVCSQELRRLLEAGDRDLTFEAIVDMIDPDDRARVHDRLNEVLASGRDFEDAFRVRLRDGSVRWMSGRVKAVADPHTGRIVELRGTAQDVTELFEALAAVRESNERFSTIFENAPVGIGTLTIDGVVVEANAALCAMLGRSSANDLGGRCFADLIHPVDRDRVVERLDAGPGSPVLARCVRTDGSTVDVRITTTVVRPGPDGRGEVILLVEDVGERKRVEAERMAREAAETANQAKNQFLSRMSHELRTPLNAILGFGQLLDLETLTPENREGAELILEAGRHLLALVNEVLEISRIESGDLSLSLEPIDLHEAVRAAVDLVGPLAAARTIRLRNEVGVETGHVTADANRVRQVLLNLLTNAVKYNVEAGAVAVSASTTPARNVRVVVDDTGPGIDPEQLGRLFFPFERLGAELSGIEGTGLGLALSKRLVEAMGGRIGVQNKPAGGSRFWFELPPADGACGPAAVRAGGHTGTVLYIEDNASNVAFVERALRRCGTVQLVSAAEASIGLALARSRRPDIILLDLNLPDLDGIEVLRRLKKECETAAIPVVVVTADAAPSHRRALLESGAHSYITKPLDVRRFLALLDLLLPEEPA